MTAKKKPTKRGPGRPPGNRGHTISARIPPELYARLEALRDGEREGYTIAEIVALGVKAAEDRARRRVTTRTRESPTPRREPGLAVGRERCCSGQSAGGPRLHQVYPQLAVIAWSASLALHP